MQTSWLTEIQNRQYLTAQSSGAIEASRTLINQSAKVHRHSAALISRGVELIGQSTALLKDLREKSEGD